MHEALSSPLEDKNVLFVINPIAGNGLSKIDREELDKAIEQVRLSGSQINVSETRAPGHATEIAKEALSDTDAIIVVGGDGTLNEVVQSTANSHVAVGIIPTGLFSIWAREMKIPTDIQKTGEMFAASQIKTVDLGKVNDVLFLQFANLGFDSEQYMKVHKPGTVRKHSAGVTFAQTFGRSIFEGWTYQGHRTGATQENKTHGIDRLLIGVISNSRKYGVLTLNEETVLDDGKLETTFFTGKLGPQFLAQFAGVILNRDKIPGVIRGSLENSLVIQADSDDKIGITVDGNPLGYANTIKATVLPRSQRVIIPQTAPNTLFK